MKTLGKVTTATFFQTAEGFAQLTALWSGLANDKEARKKLDAGMHLIYQVLRGKDWRKGFTVATSLKKLDGGYENERESPRL